MVFASLLLSLYGFSASRLLSLFRSSFPSAVPLWSLLSVCSPSMISASCLGCTFPSHRQCVKEPLWSRKSIAQSGNELAAGPVCPHAVKLLAHVPSSRIHSVWERCMPRERGTIDGGIGIRLASHGIQVISRTDPTP